MASNNYHPRSWYVVHLDQGDAEPPLAYGAVYEELFVCQSSYTRPQDPGDTRPVLFGDLELAAAGVGRKPGFRAARLQEEWREFPTGTLVLVAYEPDRAGATYVLELPSSDEDRITQ